jgi:hypothetical protein
VIGKIRQSNRKFEISETPQIEVIKYSRDRKEVDMEEKKKAKTAENNRRLKY